SASSSAGRRRARGSGSSPVSRSGAAKTTPHLGHSTSVPGSGYSGSRSFARQSGSGQRSSTAITVTGVPVGAAGEMRLTYRSYRVRPGGDKAQPGRGVDAGRPPRQGKGIDAPARSATMTTRLLFGMIGAALASALAAAQEA